MSSTKASMRKRSRPQLQDKDELSPAPTESPLSSVKRRKLNTNASSPSKPKASGALKRLGTLFGLGATKENSRDDREAIDELADSDEDNAKSEEVPKPVAKRGRPPRKEDSSLEKQARLGKRAMLNKAKALSRQAARARLEAAAQEAEESKATTSSDTRSQTNRRTQSIRDSEGIPDSDTGTLKGILTPSKKKPGRPRKSVAFENGNARDELDLGFKDLPASSSTVRKDTPGSKKRGPKGKELRDAKTLEDQEEVRQTKSIYDFEVSDEEPPVINKSKNITPKVKVGRTAKVASVDETDVEEIPEVTKTKKIAPKSNHSLVNACDEESDVEPDGDVEEDVTCLICTEAHSKKPNMILFCDGCDLAVHQKCYDVPVIPKGDWFCIDCAPQNSEDGSVQIVTEVVTDIGTHLDLAKDLPDIEDFEHHLCITQRLVLDKLTGHKPIKLRGHDDEMQKVYQVIEQTVLAGEGNSMLVIGARGCGKTTLVESVISDIATEHRDSFHIIRLNGFIHTDDKLALREIWRQLGREMEVEEDSIGKSNNYADTLASLLALLSHPSEISQGEEDQTSKSVIFILDEFDLFTTHPRQTLLYNLFDIAQAKKAPIAVLGLTTRIDVMESLEKRVKSRFSHRYVHISLPRSLPAFWDICKDGLLVNIEELRSDGRDIGTAGWDEFQSYWQTMIEELYNSDAAFKQHLHSHFYRTKSVPAFFTSCILAVANLSTSKFPLIGKDFVSTSLSAPDSKLHILQGLSDLELALLISAARLDIILDTDTCNFAMAYDEYSTLTSRHKIQTSSTGATALGSSAKVWGREVSLGAWERLAEYGLLIPASMGREAGINSSIGGRMWKVDIGLEEISGSVDGLSTVMSKWCREI